MALRIQPHDGFLLIELTEVFSTADIFALMENMMALERSSAVDSNRITDLSQLTGIDLSFRDMLTLAQKRQALKLRNHVKLALVASQPVHVGFARMYQTLISDIPEIEVKVLPTLEEAKAWVAPNVPAPKSA